MVSPQKTLPFARTLALGLCLAAPACTIRNSGPDEVTVPPGRSELVSGEVRAVDTRGGRLQLREDRGGDRTVRYDDRTRVVDGPHQFSPAALDRGDVVQVRISYDRSGTPWADRVDIRESARDRQVVARRRVERVDGAVKRLDLRRGTFTVEQPRARTVVVRIPRRLDPAAARRLERLRPGDRVKVEVRPLDRTTVELVRFR